MKKEQTVLLTLAALVLVIASAAAGAYFTRANLDNQETAPKISQNAEAKKAQTARVATTRQTAPVRTSSGQAGNNIQWDNSRQQ
ncbi:MAG: hypothetical protein JWM96_602, partial [Alphaproteobacteria bacterium]|nr:hypothetical protein [Alphaproteobacteria bacterium]